MFGWLKPDPKKKLEKKIAALLLEARDTQRTKGVLAASKLLAEAEALQQELDKLSEADG